MTSEGVEGEQADATTIRHGGRSYVISCHWHHEGLGRSCNPVTNDAPSVSLEKLEDCRCQWVEGCHLILLHLSPSQFVTRGWKSQRGKYSINNIAWPMPRLPGGQPSHWVAQCPNSAADLSVPASLPSVAFPFKLCKARTKLPTPGYQATAVTCNPLRKSRRHLRNTSCIVLSRPHVRFAGFQLATGKTTPCDHQRNQHCLLWLLYHYRRCSHESDKGAVKSRRFA